MASAVSLVAVIMGSKSDWEVMRQADEVLAQFGVPHECRVLSAHRTPAETAEYVSGAERRGMEVIIAAAGGAAHLAGVCAAHTVLPVLGVPMESAALKGLDSLQHRASGVGRADGKRGAEGPGFAALHRADAGRDSGGHARHRLRRRAQRRAAGHRYPGRQPPRIARK